MPYPDPVFAGSSAVVAQIARILETARANADRDYESTKRLVVAASSLLERHLANQGAPNPNRKERATLTRRRMDLINSFIDQNLTQPIRVSDLSSVTGISTSHFSRAFKRSFGASPHAYVMTRRIDLAMEMLLKNDVPLVEIALNCGFSDQAHFSRRFRLMTGYTPSEWRRKCP